MEINEILLKHNYQWNNSPFETGINREILLKVLNVLEARHVAAITGARRSGKSYLFRQIIRSLLDDGIKAENICQINFEDPWFIPHRESPDVLTHLYRGYKQMHNPSGRLYLFLDEIQNIKNWQYWIRDIFDHDRETRIFITGSNSDLLSTELATHLTGRVLAYEIFPFNFQEYLQVFNVKLPEIPKSRTPDKIYQSLYNIREQIIHYLERSFIRGFFPEVAFLDNEELEKDILSQYFQNVIFKDIVPRFGIRNTKIIEELAYYLSTNFTSSYSYKKLAKTVSGDEKTIKEYLTYFEKAYLFFQVEYFEYSLKKQFRRNRKIYSLDCGMRNATSFLFSNDSGRYAENMIFLNLRRFYKKIYYWQEERTQKEVDFVVKEKNRIFAINVCYTYDINNREFEALSAFSKVVKAERYIIVSRDIFENRVVDDITIEIIPLWVFLFLSLKQ